MPKIIIIIGLLPEAGSPDNVIAEFKKMWMCTQVSPFNLIGIPHTGDQILKLPVISVGKISWKISFVNETTFDCDSNTACILANKSLCISCPAHGYENVPKGNFQHVVEKFVSALLADGWTDEGNNFRHLKHT
jgi:hypothetical protein